jgi:hypothetical protein
MMSVGDRVAGQATFDDGKCTAQAQVECGATAS